MKFSTGVWGTGYDVVGLGACIVFNPPATNHNLLPCQNPLEMAGTVAPC